MAKKDKRQVIIMQSELSGHQTYATTKNKDNTPDKLELRKYDPVARKHALYKEAKIKRGATTKKQR